MTEKINGQGHRPTDVGARRSEGAKSATTSARSTAAAPQQPAARADDTVNLTQSGLLMVRLEDIVRNTPAVDVERVAAIKDAIASGSYQIDEQRIADKMLRMEKELLP
jgi:negative regulator of flagellin synthesis FlgM